MELNYAAFAIPGFFLFLGIEYFIALKQNKQHLFNYENSVANLSVGIAERLLNILVAGSFFEVFYWVYEHYSIYQIPNTWWVWVFLLLATDLVWYWYHRLGHEVNFLWAAHIVHHQSEDFNYTVSARITVFQALIRNVFWCILPFLGFHPTMVITSLVLHGAYSFFTHTQIIKRIGWIEYVLITPSLHGVHHAANDKYINKNYGDLFVFWDKLFGTFEPEVEKPYYGLTHQLHSNSFLWQHFHYYFELFEACKEVKGLSNKLKIVFGKPEHLNQGIRPKIESRLFKEKSKINLLPKKKFRTYINIQLVTCVAVLFIFTLFFNWFSSLAVFTICLVLLLTLINCGALVEQRKWILYLEEIRILILLSYVCFMLKSLSLFAVLICTLFILNYLYPFKKYYWKLLSTPD